jgi:hypothetical protein
MAFLTQKSQITQKIIITLFCFLNKNANFFLENCQKSQKTVIITSTPGCFPTASSFLFGQMGFDPLTRSSGIPVLGQVRHKRRKKIATKPSCFVKRV